MSWESVEKSEKSWADEERDGTIEKSWSSLKKSEKRWSKLKRDDAKWRLTQRTELRSVRFLGISYRQPLFWNPRTALDFLTWKLPPPGLPNTLNHLWYSMIHYYVIALYSVPVPCSMVLLLIIRLFDNQEKSCFSFHTPCHTRCIPDPYPKHVCATTSPCLT